MDFDILASLGVQLPKEPIYAATRTTAHKVIAPIAKPPGSRDPAAQTRQAASAGVPDRASPSEILSRTSTVDPLTGERMPMRAAEAPFATEAQVASMSTAEKRDLIKRLEDYGSRTGQADQKGRASQAAPLRASTGDCVIDRVKDAWCPCCVNELSEARRRLLEDLERQRDREVAQKHVSDSRRLDALEKELEAVKKLNSRRDLDAYLKDRAARKQAAAAAEQAEALQCKAQSERARAEAEAAAQDSRRRQREVAARNAQELQEMDRAHKEREARDRAEARRQDQYVLPAGLETDAERQARQLREINDFVLAERRTREEQRQRDLQDRQREAEELRAQMDALGKESQRAAEDAARKGRLLAESWTEDMQQRDARARQQRAEDLVHGREAGEAAQRALDAERQAQTSQRQAAQQELREAYESDMDGKAVNETLERLLDKMRSFSAATVRHPDHLTECDRCDIPEKPQNMTFLSSHEIADAAKYVPLKKPRAAAKQAL